MEEIGEGAGLRGEKSFQVAEACVHVCKLGGEGNTHNRIVGGVGIYEIAQPGQKLVFEAISEKAIWTAASPHC